MFIFKNFLTLIFVLISWVIFRSWLIGDPPSSNIINPIFREPTVFFIWFYVQTSISLSPIILINKRLSESQILIRVVVLILILAGSSITGIALAWLISGFPW